MPLNSTIKLTIAFTDPDLEPGERDEQAQRLITELRDLDDVETIDRVLAPNPPEGNKAFGGFLAGLLAAEVSVANAKKLMGFLGDRLGNKPIKLSVEGNGKKLSVEASSREESDTPSEAGGLMSVTAPRAGVLAGSISATR